MITKWIMKLFGGSRNDRLVRRMKPVVAKIKAFEPELQKLSDDQLKAKTDEFKGRLRKGEKLDKILPEAFAVVREASLRTLGMRHFDVQMMGGMVLHSGKISEMKTGEGKTLVATLPAYLNALTGDGVHIITVNDYLAQRDAAQMGQVFEFLGLTTGCIISNMDPKARKEAYHADITYGTNNEFGFDYLRDNMVFDFEDKVQRKLNFCVIDEVDSILIDEARTPLIISGAAESSAEMYTQINDIPPSLKKREEEEGPGDYYLDEKSKQAHLTDEGHKKVEAALIQKNLLEEGDSLYSSKNIGLMHYVTASLRAHTLFALDVDYMLIDGEVVIVDEHTGRAMQGRRWSDGLHQAIEAKEGVNIQDENQTLASITFQNYFRLYNKLSGMTGTADTEAVEFHQIYNLEVVVVPTHKPMVRQDHADFVYLTMKEKFDAVAEGIQDCIKRGQPVLVGTASIETSEYLSGLLNKKKVKHEVLNAKQNEREAVIVAQAGRPGAVTIATNMAGRGTDIILGGSWQAEIDALKNPTDEKIKAIKAEWKKRHEAVLKAGGLHILGSERHESRRIDNQLRGRSGRQGDPGSSRFYLSLEDNLVRIFASERMMGMMKKLGMGKGEAIESPMVSRAIAKAQAKVEAHHFDIRKNLLEYDNVANDQRKAIYKQRNELLGATEVQEIVESVRDDVIENIVYTHIPPQSLEEQWDIKGLEGTLQGDFGTEMPISKWLKEDENMDDETIAIKVKEVFVNTYEEKRKQAEKSVFDQFEKAVLLQSLDTHWREHLNNLEHLRSSINLRGYAQKDPKQEYKREAFNLFSEMLDNYRHDVASTISKVRVEAPEDAQAVENRWRHSVSNIDYTHKEVDNLTGEPVGEPSDSEKAHQPYVREGKKVGRNEPCPCGSGKKYKQCHGKVTS